MVAKPEREDDAVGCVLFPSWTGNAIGSDVKLVTGPHLHRESVFRLCSNVDNANIEINPLHR